MDIKLYYNSSPNNKLAKSLHSETVFQGSLRDSSRIIYPEVLIEAQNIVDFNYAYIPSFNRYYYITEIESYRTNLWIVRMKVDVLQSYKNDILDLNGILESTEEYKGNNYLSSDSWVSTVKAKTDILSFSNGLLDSGEYILITAGGIGGGV